MELFGDMRKELVASDVISYSTAISAYSRSANWDHVAQLKGEMRHLREGNPTEATTPGRFDMNAQQNDFLSYATSPAQKEMEKYSYTDSTQKEIEKNLIDIIEGYERNE